MYKIKRLLQIHMILIYFTYLYSQSSYSSSYKQVHASEDTTTTTESDDEISQERRDQFIRQFAALAQERIFKVKGQPNAGQTNTKLYVPSAMLKEYIKSREDMRKFVPDDRDFYGKINIADLDAPHEDVWSALSNNGQADIQVDMGPPEDSLDERKFNVDGKAKHIGFITLERDPEALPAKLEHVLPPHSRSVRDQKRFVSVHMKFNLSQEVYSGPGAAEDLRGAELRLTRDRIHDCEFNDCSKKPMPFFHHNQQQDTTTTGPPPPSPSSDQDGKDAHNFNRVKLVPRYQKIYILQVNGYDRYNEPQVTVIATRRIDTIQTSPIIFNIKPIVKTWLLEPKSNYGIIVRVANDDKDFDFASTLNEAKSQPNKRETNTTKQDPKQEPLARTYILDHVRLKRASHLGSDSEEVWRDKQPSLLVYSDPKEPEERYLVKRHHSESDSMQADEPDSTTQHYQQQPMSTTPGSSERPVSSTEPSGHQPSASIKPSVTTASSQLNKPAGSARRASQTGRVSSSGGRASSQQQGTANRGSKGKVRQSVKQSDKCSKRQLNINFDEVGWSNWIIAPHSYYANYCSGDCNWPLTDAQNSTNHAIIQAIYRSVGRLVPKSSCAPVKYGRMAILYQLDGIVQMRQYDDMIVEACGCL